MYGFRFNEVLRIGTFIETKGRTELTRYWKKWEIGSHCFMGLEFLFGMMKRFWRWVLVILALCLWVYFVIVQSLNSVWLFSTPLIAARQASLSFAVSWSWLRFMFIIVRCYLTISSSATLFFFLQSFPASGSFPLSQLFTLGGQSIGASVSALVLPMSIQGLISFNQLSSWFPWESKGLSRVFSSITFQKHQFFGAQPLKKP